MIRVGLRGAIAGMKRILSWLLSRYGYKPVNEYQDKLFYQHDYGAGGYQKYKDVQTLHNKRKITNVWADEQTLRFISDYLRQQIPTVTAGLCHGTRNGFEQKKFSELLGCPVMGTDISDTAITFPNSVQWDFHEVNPEWIGRFSFVYSNSLDQAFDPQKALKTWVGQLADNGLVIVEHTMAHSPSGASEMDPFGAHPLIMPGLLFEWGRRLYRLKDILYPAHTKAGGLKIWLFVVEKAR